MLLRNPITPLPPPHTPHAHIHTPTHTHTHTHPHTHTHTHTCPCTAFFPGLQATHTVCGYVSRQHSSCMHSLRSWESKIPVLIYDCEMDGAVITLQSVPAAAPKQDQALPVPYRLPVAQWLSNTFFLSSPSTSHSLSWCDGANLSASLDCYWPSHFVSGAGPVARFHPAIEVITTSRTLKLRGMQRDLPSALPKSCFPTTRAGGCGPTREKSCWTHSGRQLCTSIVALLCATYFRNFSSSPPWGQKPMHHAI